MSEVVSIRDRIEQRKREKLIPLVRQLINATDELSVIQAKSALGGMCNTDFPFVLQELTDNPDFTTQEVARLTSLARRNLSRRDFPEDLSFRDQERGGLATKLVFDDEELRQKFVQQVRAQLIDQAAPKEVQIQTALMALGLAPYYSWQQIMDIIEGRELVAAQLT